MTVLDVHEKPTRPPLKKLKKFTTKAPMTRQPKASQLVTSNISLTSKTNSTPLPTRNYTIPTPTPARFTNQTLSKKKPTGNAQKKQKTTKAPVTTQFQTTLHTASNIVPVTMTKNTSFPIRNSTASSNAKSVKQILSKQKSTDSSQKKTFTTKVPVTSELEKSPHTRSDIVSITDKTTSLPINKSTLPTTSSNVISINQTLSKQKPTRLPQKQPKSFQTKALMTSPPETTQCTGNIALMTKNKIALVPVRKSTSSATSKPNHINRTLSKQNPLRPLQKQLKNLTTSVPVTSPPETTPRTASNTASITERKTISLRIKEAIFPKTFSKTTYTNQTLYKQKPQRQVKKITQMKAKTNVRHPNLKAALKTNLLKKKKKVTAKRPHKQPLKQRVKKSKMTKKVKKGTIKPVKVKTSKVRADSKNTKGQ